MAISYETIMALQAEKLETLHAEAIAEIEAGRLANDTDRVSAAADSVLQIDAARNALATRASRFYAEQGRLEQQAASNPWQLSPDEREIANGCGLSEEEYFRQKQRLADMRARGEYRDDQGTVRR